MKSVGIFQLHRIILAMVWIVFVSESKAQGCSDAGVCTIEVFKPSVKSGPAAYPNKIEGGFHVGAADYSITAYGGYMAYSHTFNSAWSVDGKFTFLAQSGNDISVIGPGDLFLNLNYDLTETFTVSAGTKIPMTRADESFNDLPLPMDYQSSLGTLDILAGIRYNPEHWQWALAAQIPVRQNDNQFFPGLYPPGSGLDSIQATNAFQRKSDLLLHVSRTFDMSDRITLTPGLMPIYHLGQDEYTDIDGVQQKIQGSDGLTLNATLYMDIRSGDQGKFQFSLGFPLIVREARPDGLTRSFVFAAGYSYSF